MTPTRSTKGFSLIELVIVVVIIGILGAIAVPRLSRGSTGTQEQALLADLSIIRSAIELYAAEHNSNYPTQAGQLLYVTDDSGNIDNGSGGAGGYIYGPYLRAAPPAPIGTKRGLYAMEVTHDKSQTPPGSDDNAAWWYNSALGQVRLNVPDAEVDSAGKKLNSY